MLGHSTVHTIHAALHTALHDALSDELIYRNVADVVKPAPFKLQERTILTPADANKLLAVADEDRWEALYWLALQTGMREGELISLKWSDVDLSRRVLTIREAKTDAGVRKLGLIPQVIEQLQAQKVHLMEERLQAGPRWKDQGPQDGGWCFPIWWCATSRWVGS